MNTIVSQKVRLNLQELNGNAFCLMGAFQKAARNQGIRQAQVDAVIKECQSGDYDHLLQTLIANTESEDSE